MCATRARARTPKYIDRVYALRCLGTGGGSVSSVGGEKRTWREVGFGNAGVSATNACQQKKTPAHPKDNNESGVRRQMR